MQHSYQLCLLAWLGFLQQVYAQNATDTAIPEHSEPAVPASFKIIGVLLAVGSGLFIGASFVFKKKGLLSAQAKAGGVAGEGHPYLKSPMWWTGMTMMIVGEILNFAAYAFTDAILVTPLGALSVVICAILSSIFLKECLTFFGKIGCTLCILGAVIIALNGPGEQSTSTIPVFQKLFLSPGFLVYGGIVILASLGLIFFAVPRWGKTHMLVHIAICSMIGGLSVVTTQGLGAAILTTIRGTNQFKYWFIYFLIGFVVITLLTEINYLNKALELFNTATVTPTYYVLFTGCTLISSCILYKGFKASVPDILSVVFGFLVICCGITLLQLSKIDPEEIKENITLDRRSTILLAASRSASRANTIRKESDAEKGLDIEDPGVDTIRGTFGAIGSVHRAISSRRAMRNSMYEPEAQRRRGHRVQDSDSALNMEPVRHQLYDNPMPADFNDKISMHSGLSAPEALSRARSASVTFSPIDTHHRYPPVTSPGGAVHETRPVVGHMHVDSSPSMRPVVESPTTDISNLSLPPPYPKLPTSPLSESPTNVMFHEHERSNTFPRSPTRSNSMGNPEYASSSPNLAPVKQTVLVPNDEPLTSPPKRTWLPLPLFKGGSPTSGQMRAPPEGETDRLVKSKEDSD